MLGVFFINNNMNTTSFNGNLNLKPVYQKENFTKHQIQEIIKCKQDPIYFFENYVTIVNLDRGKIKFKPYDFQKDMVNNFRDFRFSINAVARQSGKTTVTTSFILWYILFIYLTFLT